MRIIEVEQGSAAWQAERARRFTASEAPAMMGASKYLTRAALMAQKHTGLAPEVSAPQQALYDRGHNTEAAARALLEDELGELYPVTAVHDTDDRLLASVDGITFDDSTLFEHKLWSESLAAQVRAGELEPHYYWQLEQQLLVTGAERVIFVCSDGTREHWAQMDYRPVAGRREQLLAGWDQFEKDLAAYTPPAAAAPRVVAEPVEALPAVAVHVEGSIVIRENFDAFERAMRDFLEHRLIRKPETDQDFADLDVQIKAMKGAEKALDEAEAGWIAQIEPVSTAKRRKDMLRTLVRENRLMAEKLMASEKEHRRSELVTNTAAALRQHVESLNERLGRPLMPPASAGADFAGAIKGMRSLDSMKDALGVALATAKIAANEIADRIDRNLKHLREHANEHRALFPDVATIVLKAPEDLQSLVSARIAEHKAAEEKRAAELAERERARIRAEEEARAAEKVRREQEAREAEERRQRAAAEEAERRQAAADQEEKRRQSAVLDAQQERPAQTTGLAPSPAANVVPMPTKAPATPQPATLTLGAICQRLGFTVSADFIKRLGVEPAQIEGRAQKFTEHQFSLICEALVAHVRTVQAKREAA